MTNMKFPVEFTELEMTQLHNVAALVLSDPEYFNSLFAGAERAALVRAKDRLARAIVTLNTPSSQ